MEIITVLVRQTLTMFLLSAVGFGLFRSGKISLEGSKSIGNVLIYVVLPSVIVKGFQVERTQEHIQGLIFSAVISSVILILSILCSRLCFPKDAIAGFAAAFSNPGFFGIPLIIASISNEAVFYVASFIAFLNLLQWSYGVALMTQKRGSIKPGAILKAPFMIAILIGLLLFFSEVKIPSIMENTLSYLAGLNTPLAMFITGIYLAQIDIREMLCEKKLYVVSAVRLVLVPIIVLLCLCLIPQRWYEMKMTLLLAAACPVGTNVAVYAQLHGKDYGYAVKTVVVSTFLSILTIPIITYIAQRVW